MSIFDLLFLFLVLAAAISLAAAGVRAIQKQFAHAGHVLLVLLIGAALYMTVVVVVSLVLPRRVLQQSEIECFDDWCIGVAGIDRVASGSNVNYRVEFRLSSRAMRVAQREKNLAVYLTDDQGRRYDPTQASAAAPFSVLLQPGESAMVSRAFVVPAAAKGIGLVIAHEGGFPIGWFIIGYETWFRKPALMKLAQNRAS